MAIRVETYKPYLGVGPVYARPAGQPDGPLYHLGNTSELKLAHDEAVTEQPDYDSPGGGTHAEVRRINSVTASFVMHDLNADNLAMATRGTNTAVAGGSITDEAHTAHVGGLIRLEHPGATSAIVTSADGQTTYNDIEITGAGVKVLASGDLATAINALPDATAGLPVKVSYTHPGYNQIEALTETGKVWELVFDGMNEADSGKPCVLDLWRVNLGVASELALKGDAFGSLPLSGKLLKDASKGSGKSAFYRMQQV